MSKPMLGLLLGTVLGLLDGLSGLFYPELGPILTRVIFVSTLKGVAAGFVIGLVAQRLHSMVLGIGVGLGVGTLLSYLVTLFAGPGLFWDIVLPGMLLGVIVGFATQRYGRPPVPVG